MAKEPQQSAKLAAYSCSECVQLSNGYLSPKSTSSMNCSA